MERLPEPLATHPPLPRRDLPASSAPSGESAAVAASAPTGADRPCHLPIAWAARPDLDHHATVAQGG